MVEYWNWAKTFRCRPLLYVEPTSIDSLRISLKEINKTKSKIRIIGCAHSPSALSMSNEVLISMKNFNRILEIDKENLVIHCESGVLLSTLNEILPQYNLSLPVQGSVSTLTIAGAISTATHGSGIQYGTLSSYVRSITLMKLDGELKEFRLEDDEDLFRCLTCCLGTFGIIISVRLQVSRLFYLELNQHPLEFRKFLNTLPVYYSSSDHFRYMWYPHTNFGIAYHLNRVQPRIINNKNSFLSKFISWFRYSLIGYHLLEVLFLFSLYFPRFIRCINNIYFKLDGRSCHKIDRCDKLFNFDCLFYQYANEWAIPLDQAVSCLLQLEKLMEQNNYVHFPIEIRFSKDEDLSYLSPAYKRKTCWINTVAYRPFGKNHLEHQTYFKAFESICYKHNGRPHWAKEHPLTNEDFSKLYPQWNLFHQKRKEFDPNDLFLNDCLRNMFS
ncbi:unnamed protein product [Rotaria socialis]|uniref:FAD-binding PCMH-type domain-containing protein n=1 Tax=Rotaria socialis TaxID=392032 RepID=A0A817TGM6_9BILA|nr:unnamed protein product [Rotaria socialis]CAF3315051.1 unnamed protein product [Rotaria socialis]CAF3326840.1 unnamed protein product [Rotaria socialis]CAF3470654.1 unnamed protein product [Rotaria socialis]CAF4100780.1 unnamed protein product [Rotaria socialis]